MEGRGEGWTSLKFPPERRDPEDERYLADVSRKRGLEGVRSLTWDGEQGVRCNKFPMLWTQLTPIGTACVEEGKLARLVEQPQPNSGYWYISFSVPEVRRDDELL